MGQNERLNRLRQALVTAGQTQLGIGPMSRACVDAVIELANEHRLPLMLIASRRQVECGDQGGGYVNGWTTETFSRYVRERDHGGFVLHCRDHGGPWQNYPEVVERMSLAEAMESAKTSLAEDIRCGFDILHLDPSVALLGSMSPGDVFAALQELYLFCDAEARRAGRDVAFEVGREEQTGQVQPADEVESLLREIERFCANQFLPRPLFVVAQMGTLVKETYNVGGFALAGEDANLTSLENQVKAITAVTRRYGVWIKEHNADYLPAAILRRRPSLGIGALNIAPELGVAETEVLLQICRDLGLLAVEERFLALAFHSHKWEKWLLPDTTATDRDKAVLAGHYVFGTPEFAELYQHLVTAGAQHNLDVNARVTGHLKKKLLYYLTNLALIRKEKIYAETH